MTADSFNGIEDKKLRIGVLGGSFDPVHMGHQALGKAAIAEAELYRLIVMPAGVQPFKQGLNVTEACHREAMAKLAFEDDERVLVSRYEIENKENVSYTVKTLLFLQNQYIDAKIFFICGTDSFLSMETWYRGAEILENFSLIVSARPGYKEEQFSDTVTYYAEKYKTETIKLTAKMPDISSTNVRKKISQGQSIEGMVPKAVERYIKANGLYK